MLLDSGLLFWATLYAINVFGGFIQATFLRFLMFF